MFSTPARKRAGLVLLYACGAAFLMLVVAVLASLQEQAAETRHLAQSVRDTQIEGTPLGKQLAASADRILDCTDSTGDCYKRNQARTAKVVGDLNRVIVLAAACSVGLEHGLTVDQRQVAIQGCVLDRLAQQAAQP
jgi:hypothetical protein